MFEGEVVYVYPYLDPRSRTVNIRLEFENPDLLLMPDMFGRVQFAPHRMGRGLRVPRSSVMETGQRELVYVVRPGHRFEAREVRTGMELDGGLVEVLDGLKAGEEVVASPHFLMDSESRIRLLNRKFEPTPERSQSGARMPNMPGMDMRGMKGEMKKSGKTDSQ